MLAANTLEPIPAVVPITPTDRLYVNSYPIPPDPARLADYTLMIDGLVANPQRLTMEAIRAMPALDSMRTLACISNPLGGGLIGNVVWRGVAFAPILAALGVRPEATHVHFEAADRYTTAVELKWITQADVLLAYGINGEALPDKHGAPLRLLMPGLYGQKMPKWITRITFADRDKLGYWEQEHRGWSNIAAVKTISQIRTPERNVMPYQPRLRLQGLAYAGARAITQVEIAITQSEAPREWQSAQLIKPSEPLAWTWWSAEWSPPARGDYQLVVRATDDQGFTQFQAAKGFLAGAFPEGTAAIHAVGLRLE